MAEQQTANRTERVIVRKPGRNMAEGLRTGVGIPDFERARLQHIALCEALRAAGADVTVLPPDTHFPDASFVGDMAVVTPRLAVIGNFGEDDPRQGEQQAAAAALAGARFLKFVTPPGMLDAADVLRLDGHYYISLSDSTNQEGAAQLAFSLKEFGYEASVIDLGFEDAPRLSACAVYLGNGRVLVREEVAQHYIFVEYEKVVVPREEKSAAASLLINGTLIMPQGFPRLRSELRLLDIPLIEVNVSEFEKTGGALSCLALPLQAGEKSAVALAPRTLAS
jgi:dimethylargininase